MQLVDVSHLQDSMQYKIVILSASEGSFPELFKILRSAQNDKAMPAVSTHSFKIVKYGTNNLSPCPKRQFFDTET